MKIEALEETTRKVFIDGEDCSVFINKICNEIIDNLCSFFEFETPSKFDLDESKSEIDYLFEELKLAFVNKVKKIQQNLRKED